MAAQPSHERVVYLFADHGMIADGKSIEAEQNHDDAEKDNGYVLDLYVSVASHTVCHPPGQQSLGERQSHYQYRADETDKDISPVFCYQRQKETGVTRPCRDSGEIRSLACQQEHTAAFTGKGLEAALMHPTVSRIHIADGIVCCPVCDDKVLQSVLLREMDDGGNRKLLPLHAVPFRQFSSDSIQPDTKLPGTFRHAQDCCPLASRSGYPADIANAHPLAVMAGERTQATWAAVCYPVLLKQTSRFKKRHYILYYYPYGNGISNELVTDSPSLSMKSHRSALYSIPL